MADILTEIRKIPPVTRFLVGSSVGITLPAIMQLISPYTLVFISNAVINKWEVCSYFLLSISMAGIWT